MAALKEEYLVSDPGAASAYADTLKRKVSLSGEKMLMLAVLEDAVEIYKHNRTAKERKKQALYAETEAWIFARDDDALFSFNSVCDALGFDAEYLRAGLIRYHKDKGAGHGARGARSKAAKHKRVA